MKALKRFLLCLLAGVLTLSTYSLINASLAGAKDLDFWNTILFSPAFAIFLHYDIFFLGKTKLLSSLAFFYLGASLSGLWLWLPRKLSPSSK